MKLCNDKLINFFDDREIFNCEFSFQFELAWWLKQDNSDIKIIFEDKKCYENIAGNKEHRTPRCDLVIFEGNYQTFLELKYVRSHTNTTSVGARKSFVKDFSRLKKIVKNTDNDGYCIFLTDWASIYNDVIDDKDNEVLNQFKQYFAKSEWIPLGKNKNFENFRMLLVNVKDEKYNNVIEYEEVIQKYKNK